MEPFVRYAIRGLVDQLREQVGWIPYHQMDVTWRNYVHDVFQREAPSAVRDGQQALVLEISGRDEAIDVAQVAGLTPKLAALYRHKTNKTISRDINRLIAMGLLERNRNGIRARKKLVAAFLPARRKAASARAQE